MLFSPKECGQGALEFIILLALIVWLFITILRLPDCGGEWTKAILLWMSCN